VSGLSVVRRRPYIAPASGGGSPTGGGAFTWAEQFGDVYPGQTDAVLSRTVPARTDAGYTSYAKHDASPMPDMASVLDWSIGVTKQTWPSDGTWSDNPYHNVWWQIVDGGGDPRVIVDLFDPVVCYSTSNGADPWVKQSYPSPGSQSMWKAWISSTSSAPFTQLDPGPPISYNSAGGYFSVDLSAMPSNQFAHGAYNYFFPRAYCPPGSAISTQFKARLRAAASGVDLSTKQVYVNCGNDRYSSAGKSTDPVNGATGESRFKLLPTDGSTREIGYHTVSSALLTSNPPPLLEI
jgi:hypothetical protein